MQDMQANLNSLIHNEYRWHVVEKRNARLAMKPGKWHVLQQDLKGYIHENTLLYKQLSMACMSCMRFGTFIENTNTAALPHDCGCVGSRLRLRCHTNTAALAHECGCVKQQEMNLEL